MKESTFFAGSISTDDAYYLDFADRRHQPSNCISVQGVAGKRMRVAVRALGHDAAGEIGNLHATLGRHSFEVRLPEELSEALGGITSVEARFDVDDEKYAEIQRQLQEIRGDNRRPQ